MARSRRVRDDDLDLVHLYVSDVGRRGLLTKDDETRLAKLIEAGADARRQLRDRGGASPGRRRALCRTVRAGDDALEIADADAPHTPRGCPFQAWSVGEALRLDLSVLVSTRTARETRPRAALAVGR